MDFELTDEQELVREAVKEFADAEAPSPLPSPPRAPMPPRKPGCAAKSAAPGALKWHYPGPRPATGSGPGA